MYITWEVDVVIDAIRNHNDSKFKFSKVNSSHIINLRIGRIIYINALCYMQLSQHTQDRRMTLTSVTHHPVGIGTK